MDPNILPGHGTRRLVSFLLAVILLGVMAAAMAQPRQAAGQRLAPVATPMPGLNIFLPLISRPVVSLAGQVTKTSLTLPKPLQGMVSSWCTMSWCSITPRLYHEPTAGGGALLGWTDSSGNGHVSVISPAGSLGQTFNYTGRSLRGLVAHSDGKFAVMLYDPASTIMWLTRYNANGSQAWSTNIKGPLTRFDGGIGDSRLAYGSGLYAAYFAVYGVSGWVQGHNGDQLTYVNDSGAIQSGGWEWGCSHSMAELINYHPGLAKFMPLCTSDCYASKALLISDSKVVYACDGNCHGEVSAQLGQAAQTPSGWKVAFSALGTANVTGKGIGLATINADFTSSYIWLTNTNGATEREPVIARLGTNLSSNRFLVGWKTTNDGVYHLELITGNGTVMMPLENVSSAGIRWGDRDDSLRTRPDGNVSWVQGNAGSTTLNYYVFNVTGRFL